MVGGGPEGPPRRTPQIYPLGSRGARSGGCDRSVRPGLRPSHTLMGAAFNTTHKRRSRSALAAASNLPASTYREPSGRAGRASIRDPRGPPAEAGSSLRSRPIGWSTTHLERPCARTPAIKCKEHPAAGTQLAQAPWSLMTRPVATQYSLGEPAAAALRTIRDS